MPVAMAGAELSTTTHQLQLLPTTFVAAAMGHSLETHLAAYSRWIGDDEVDAAFERASQRMEQDLRAG